MDAFYANWVSRWNKALEAAKQKGGENCRLVIDAPALPDDINEIEKQIGHILPVSFRQVLVDFSAHVEISWILPDNCNPPEAFRHISWGECTWGLSNLLHLAEGYQLGLDVPYNPDDPYDDPVWHNKLALIEVGNGDIIAFDLNFMPDPPVVYLSHDDGEGHGYRLGDNFIDFVERHSLLGCPSYEDWQMMPFLDDPTSGLNATGENARKWREWFGLDFEVT